MQRYKGQQYSQLYFFRLHTIRQNLLSRVQERWPSLPGNQQQTSSMKMRKRQRDRQRQRQRDVLICTRICHCHQLLGLYSDLHKKHDPSLPGNQQQSSSQEMPICITGSLTVAIRFQNANRERVCVYVISVLPFCVFQGSKLVHDLPLIANQETVSDMIFVKIYIQ